MRFNLAHALMTMSRCGEAVGEFERTLALRPDYREVHYHLASCYDRLGDPFRARAARARYGSAMK